MSKYRDGYFYILDPVDGVRRELFKYLDKIGFTGPYFVMAVLVDMGRKSYLVRGRFKGEKGTVEVDEPLRRSRKKSSRCVAC